MNRGEGKNSPIAGFTIVETLIFLAVSAAIFFSTMLLMSGRQNREYFQVTVRDFESRLVDIANDISTGYYQNGTPLMCQAGGSGPTFPAGSRPLGTNDECILAGTVIKFGDGGNQENMIRFTMAGLRQVGGQNTTNLQQARPQVVNRPGAFSSTPIGAGTTVQCVGIGTTTCNPNSTANAAVGFFTTFDGTGLAAQSGGVIRANVIGFPGVNLGNDATTAITALNGFSYATATQNPGIVICLRSGTTNQYALVQLGTNSSSGLTASSEIRSFTGPTPPCN